MKEPNIVQKIKSQAFLRKVNRLNVLCLTDSNQCRTVRQSLDLNRTEMNSIIQHLTDRGLAILSLRYETVELCLTKAGQKMATLLLNQKEEV